MKSHEWEALRYCETPVFAHELENQQDRVLLFGYDMVSRYRDPDGIFCHDRTYLVSLVNGEIKREKFEGPDVIDSMQGPEWQAWMLVPADSVLSSESDFDFVQHLIGKGALVPLKYTEDRSEMAAIGDQIHPHAAVLERLGR